MFLLRTICSGTAKIGNEMLLNKDATPIEKSEKKVIREAQKIEKKIKKQRKGVKIIVFQQVDSVERILNRLYRKHT